MRLQKVSRTASSVGPASAPPIRSRVEPIEPVEPAQERQTLGFRRRLPDQHPDKPTQRGTYLNLVV